MRPVKLTDYVEFGDVSDTGIMFTEQAYSFTRSRPLLNIRLLWLLYISMKSRLITVIESKHRYMSWDTAVCT